MDKQQLRKKVNKITIVNKEKKEQIIASYLLDTAEYKAAKDIFLFLATLREPDTLAIVASAMSQNKNVYAPVTGDTIQFAPITKDTTFVVGKYDIVEPKEPQLVSITPDIVIVPMVACDNNLGRLGHGGGYYDKFLGSTKATKIGITFSDFIVESVLADSYDIAMDIIITDKGIIK